MYTGLGPFIQPLMIVLGMGGRGGVEMNGSICLMMIVWGNSAPLIVY